MTLTFIRKWLFVLFYLLLFTIAINLVVLNRFWQYEAFYFDHGIFDSSLWQVAHFQTPIIDHLEGGFISQFGDHFTPTLYLLAPIYWLTSAYEPILVAGNLMVAASAFVIFLIAKAKISSRLLVLAIVVAYTLYIGLQNTVIANLHSELPAMLTLALTLLFLDKKKWIYYWIFLILTLGSKQNFASISVGLGVYLFFRKEKLIGIATIIFSFAYYLFATKFAIPFWGQQQYAYNPDFHLDWSAVKTETLLTSLATFGFLPLLTPAFLPAILQDFVTRFFFASPARWGLGLHYSATVSVLLAYGAILTAAKIKKYAVPIAIAIILLTLFFHRFKFHGALGLAYNPDFYRHTKDLKFLDNFLAQIPPGKSVMTLNNLAPHLTHTNKVMLLGDYHKLSPEIIALDIRPGQNPANFWPVQGDYQGWYLPLYSDPSYKLVKFTDYQLLFVKQ